MKRIAILLLLAAVLAVTGCGDKKTNIKPPHDLDTITPSLKIDQLWTARVGRGSDSVGVRMRPVADNGVIYAASADDHLAAIDAATGKKLWEKQPSWRRGRSDTSFVGGPTVAGDLLVVGTLDGNVFAFDTKTGEQRWQATVKASILTPPVFDQALLFIRTDNGDVTALNSSDGSQAWLYDQGSVPTLSLRGNSPLLAAHGVIFFGSDDGKVVALRADNGQPLWDQTISQGEGRTEIERLDDADGPLLLHDNTLYATAYHGHLTAIDAPSGRPSWTQPFSSFVGVDIGGSTLVGVDADSDVWAFDATNGGNLWKQDGLSWRWLTTPTVQGSHVVLGDVEGYVHWLNLADGGFAARQRMSHDRIRARPLVVGDVVIAEDVKGNLTAWRVSSP